MKWLLRLYPRVWRHRYGAEFEELLRYERLGVKGVLDVVTSAVAAHGQVFVADAAATIAALARVRPELRAMNWFTGVVALTTGLIGGFRHHWTLEYHATFVATVSVLVLALLSHLEARVGTSARNAIILIGVPMGALHLNLWQTSPGEPNPVLFAFLVAIPATPWPDAEHLRALRISEALCYVQALITVGTGVVRGVPIVVAVLLGCVWLGLGVLQRRRWYRVAVVPRLMARDQGGTLPW